MIPGKISNFGFLDISDLYTKSCTGLYPTTIFLYKHDQFLKMSSNHLLLFYEQKIQRQNRGTVWLLFYWFHKEHSILSFLLSKMFGFKSSGVFLTKLILKLWTLSINYLRIKRETYARCVINCEATSKLNDAEGRRKESGSDSVR